jgi:ArsR family transcriptional regulator, arsenate/arsenite/antimonite-responsive transcriptional repressor
MRMQATKRGSAAEDVGRLSRMLKALGDQNRLRMVALLSHGELCVCHLESALGLTQWATSRHVSALRDAGVIESDRRGTWVYCRLADQQDEDCKSVLRSLLTRFRAREVFRRDAERLMRTRTRGQCS